MNSSLSLFDIASSPQISKNPVGRSIILDPDGVYSPDCIHYTVIETEVDWMRHFGRGNHPCWVRGKTLCAWAEEWLRCWHRTDDIAAIKRSPREKLVSLLAPIAVPQDWTDSQCLAVVSHLEQYDTQPIAHLLANLTASDPDLWLGDASLENLAWWLTVPVSLEAQVLERVWQTYFANSDLATYYQTLDKRQLLRRWLSIAEPPLTELGPYPLGVPPTLQEEFTVFWERKLYSTEGQVLDTLDFATQSAPQQIASIAYEVFKQRPDYITQVREKRLKGYLSHHQREDLTLRQQPPEPQALSIDAETAEALHWATEKYLPLRRWETINENLPPEKQVCNRLANSFEEWMLRHYPDLIIDSVSTSWLNYNVSHHVQELCSQGPVFWIIVDGLGWFDHQVLLALLTEQKELQLERGLEPRFSILPTKTEYAKWSLYSQRRPGHGSWKPNAGEGFKVNNFLTQNGKRYTDNDVTKKRLQKDLQSGNQQLYCWDTDRFDHLFHNEVDWQELYNVKRRRELNAITEDILRFVNLHPKKDELQVVIASDHGQLMGVSSKLANVPEGLEPKGRMAIGKAEHPQLAILDKGRFDLPHDISIIRGPNSFSSFSYADDKSIIGCHGGLYPEEVVVGFSVLKRSVKRAPVIVKCSGKGRPGESSTLNIEIYNPNPLVLEDLKITVPQLGVLQSGQALEGIIEPKKTQLLEVPIPKWPELPPSHEGKSLSLTGELEFRYRSAELASVELDKDSAIEVIQIFSSGIEGLDDFL